MSSSTTVRRVKERGGAGGKIMALKPQKSLTPIPDKENVGSCKKTAGKEKPRSVSVTRVPSISQKPVIRSIPMSQIDKAVGPAKDGDGRVRWSTTSLARGKNSKSNPSDFARFLSDFRKDRLSTGSSSGSTRSVNTVESGSVGGTNLVVSNGGKGLNGFRVLERYQQNKPSLDSNSKDNELKVVGGSRNVDSGKENRKDPNGSGAVEENRKKDSFLDSNAKLSVRHSSGVRVLDDYREKINLSSQSMASDEKDANSASGSSKYNCYLDSSSKVTSEQIPNGKSNSDKYSKGPVEIAADGFGNVEKSRDMACLGSRPNQPCEKASGVSKVSEISKEKIANEGKGVRAVNKYPSKLHQKLAFLEGKVKRIASDIKRTKEMLDMNNTDASKMILSDIQDKISGIEKAMVHVVNDDGSSLDSSKTVEGNIPHCKIVEKTETKQVEQPKSLAKGLNHEELEARLFPHHKLLRNRTSVCTASGSSQNHVPSLRDSVGESKPENGSLSPIDENPIALEFLASLNTNQSKVGTRDEHADLEFSEIQEMDGTATSAAQNNTKFVDGKHDLEINCDENLEDFDDQENRPTDVIHEDTEDACLDQLHEIGCKASTGGWFVSEGEAVLLAHDDGSCSYYDITNSEEKAEYMPPAGVSPNIWGDCWLVRAPGADGCSGRYVVAASAGNTLESGFCSWDFYTKDVRAFHIEDGKTISSSRTVLGPLPNNSAYRRNALSTVSATENQQWWYKPCGPLIVSTASSQKAVKVYDIRDGELMMKWDVQRPVLGMEYSSPLQWRNRGKVVLTDTENISLWDVNSLNPQALLSVSSSGQKISALHVNNTDAELGGGVRQRVSSSEAEGNDGVFCTAEGINVLDFRLPSGVGLKISKLGVSIQSVFSRGDSIFLGCTNTNCTTKESSCSQVQQFSVRNGKLLNTYALPDLNAHFHSSAILQVWGNSSFVMGVCSLGLFIFDALKDEGMQSIRCENIQKVRDIIGPDDLYSPSFDYLSSRVLLISKDRPALWRHLL
ncbi:KIN14B-interacting protein At4g14310-like [Telopea speciosissima]|uniref:KIN14B-interacting protein At4g14310-like n=1 Tax=Telopea speciosissima TaxID=54955 RepID=UPI001CC6876E|nr:KIN14B-interacting protein At4g14310-like [Telopea speciosissima]